MFLCKTSVVSWPPHSSSSSLTRFLSQWQYYFSKRYFEHFNFFFKLLKYVCDFRAQGWMKGRFLCLKCVQGFRDVGAVFWEGGAVKSTEHRQMNVLLEPSRTNKPAGFYLCCCLLVQSTKWHHCVTGSITHMLKWHNQHLHLEKLLHSRSLWLWMRLRVCERHRLNVFMYELLFRL